MTEATELDKKRTQMTEVKEPDTKRLDNGKGCLDAHNIYNLSQLGLQPCNVH